MDAMEYERFYERTYDEEEYYGLRRRFVAVICGRLGLRRGELCHLEPGWIDLRNKMISIPRHYDCDDGREGGRCGDCRQAAKQQANEHEDRSFQEVLDAYWVPKSEAAVRDVYFGWNARIELIINKFIERFDGGWMWSAATISRDVNKMAQAAGFNLERVYPHSLRATAATNLAVQGMNIYQLMQYFGWKKFSTAEKYISRNALLTAKQMDAQSMGLS